MNLDEDRLGRFVDRRHPGRLADGWIGFGGARGLGGSRRWRRKGSVLGFVGQLHQPVSGHRVDAMDSFHGVSLLRLAGPADQVNQQLLAGTGSFEFKKLIGRWSIGELGLGEPFTSDSVWPRPVRVNGNWPLLPGSVGCTRTLSACCVPWRSTIRSPHNFASPAIRLDCDATMPFTAPYRGYPDVGKRSGLAIPAALLGTRAPQHNANLHARLDRSIEGGPRQDPSRSSRRLPKLASRQLTRAGRLMPAV